ncbi:hypothetical protein JANAI62_03560 [Jannaschia pagri]|uniref:Uncharacterized protein n=1 Tax=Jannaschia pagri TaxID=2829797 RepID=A0ABQ4NH28_9RHOB|nr:hypothetical protein JANAI61_06190 [Jannaschia sp. AI_61]GIT93733.1 hypothetical protein JANAI62_03560 [Jannaschia sp. AI_62]
MTLPAHLSAALDALGVRNDPKPVQTAPKQHPAPWRPSEGDTEPPF